MSEILVTGGAGYVGSVCTEELLRLGHFVSVVDDLSTGHREAVPRGAELYTIDIGDDPELRRLLASKNFDAVFHFAAKALIPESVTDPASFYRVNMVSATTMLNAVRDAGIERFIFSSSAAIYGNSVEIPIVEDQPKSPVNSYGETKLSFERQLEWYARAYGMNVFAFRYFNASGATGEHGECHQPETHILPLIFEAAIGERDAFTIFGGDYPTPDGTCIRDYVHVSDIARAHILALESTNTAPFNAFNIGVGRGHSVSQIITRVESVIGRKVPVRMGQRRMGDPAVLCASPARLIRELGWSPQHSGIDHIIETAWEWKQKLRSRSNTSIPVNA